MNIKFKVGDKVWAATCGIKDISVPCPVCYGKLKISVILGNGDTHSIDCDFCGGRSYEGAKGYCIQNEWFAAPEQFLITGMDIDDKITYKSRISNCSWRNFEEEDVFATKEEAEIRCQELVKQKNESEQKHFESKEKADKTYSWHVGYHKREVKRLQEQLAYHLAKIPLMQAKSEK